MLLGLFGFLNITLTDVLDILLVAVLIFAVVRWMRNSSALNIFISIILIYVLKVLVDTFHMNLMGSLLGTFIDVGVLAIIVIFQPEIRHFLMKVGSGSKLSNGWNKILGQLFGQSSSSLDSVAVKELTEACRNMSEEKTGALIVLPHKDSLSYIIETGDRIDANISRRLIMNLFFKNSPLHDGAVIINNDKIVAARCTLPITEKADIPAHFGMRHKAAIGITEESDADVIVVSEETGRISFVREGQVTAINNLNELKLLLNASMHGTTVHGEETDNKNSEDKAKTQKNKTEETGSGEN